MTSFCSNKDLVGSMSIFELHDLIMSPMTKFYCTKSSIERLLKEAKVRTVKHPDFELIQKLIKQLEKEPNIELLKGQLHFDLHQGNVLVDGEEIVIIDWEVGHSGLGLLITLIFIEEL